MGMIHGLRPPLASLKPSHNDYVLVEYFLLFCQEVITFHKFEFELFDVSIPDVFYHYHTMMIKSGGNPCSNLIEDLLIEST